MNQSGDFLAKIRLALEGKETVVGGLKETQQAAQQLSKTKVTTTFDKEGVATGKQLEETFTKIGDNAKKTTPLMAQLGMAMSRALIVAPVWMAMRALTQALIAPVQELTKAFFELDEGMAKLGTVSSGSTIQQKKFFGEVSAAAWEYYRTSTMSMKQITEAMYTLGKAGRDNTGILTGFQHVLDLSEGTFNDVTTAANLTQGVLNTFGDSLKKLPTEEAKTQYVTDLLAYSLNKTRADAGELSQVLGLIGGSAQGLNIDLTTVLGTVGFLSTGMLQGRRAGMALLSIFSDLSTRSDKLKTIGITFDVRRPVDFLNIMTQLKAKFADRKDLVATQELVSIFGTTGANAVRKIIDNWDEWISKIHTGETDFGGAAKKFHEAAESSLGQTFKKVIRDDTMAIAKFIGVMSPITYALKGYAMILDVIIDKVAKTRNAHALTKKDMALSAPSPVPGLDLSTYNKMKSMLDVTKKVNVDIGAELSSQINKQRDALKLEMLKQAGATESEVAYRELSMALDRINKNALEYNKANKDSGAELFHIVTVAEVLQGNWNNIINLGKSDLDVQKDILELEKLRNVYIKDRAGLESKVQKPVVFPAMYPGQAPYVVEPYIPFSETGKGFKGQQMIPPAKKFETTSNIHLTVTLPDKEKTAKNVDTSIQNFIKKLQNDPEFAKAVADYVRPRI